MTDKGRITDLIAMRGGRGRCVLGAMVGFCFCFLQLYACYVQLHHGHEPVGWLASYSTRQPTHAGHAHGIAPFDLYVRQRC